MGLVSSAFCCVSSAGCCLCNCLSRLCGRGGGGDQSKEYPTGCGRTGSVALMLVAIVLALLGQTWWYEFMDDIESLKDVWTEGCHKSDSGYPRCREYAATFRVAFVTTAFFLFMAVLSKLRPVLHDYGWDPKFTVYFLCLVASLWMPNAVFNEHGYLWFARLGGFVFIVLQQIILIDGAYTVNELLYEYGSAPGMDEGLNKWLLLLLALSALFFAGSFTGFVLLFLYYSDCSTSATILSLALIFIVIFVVLQLTSDPEHGHNLLASSVVAAYVTYLSYVAVSSNPEEKCNPNYYEGSNNMMMIMGLVVTFISIGGTVYFSSRSVTGLIDSSHHKGTSLTDVLISDAPHSTTSMDQASVQSDSEVDPKTDTRHWRFNLVMALISMYWCCVLTDWGNYEAGSAAAAPTAGTTAMWINAAASWICIMLYSWTLVAPRLFPDRDFS